MCLRHPETGGGWFALFQAILHAAVAAPEMRILKLPLLTLGEQHTLLNTSRGGAKEYPRHATLHHMFQLQAASNPDAPCLFFENSVLSYRQVEGRANQVAHLLVSRGVSQECLVGLMLDRSLELIICMLKAGAGYVPLDPSYPTTRLLTMWEDSEAHVLLTTSSMAPLWTESMRTAALQVDLLAFKGNEAPLHPPRGSPSSLAYCIFTSGSTGRPKGVLVEHGGVVNEVLWRLDMEKFSGADRFLHKPPLSFDPSVEEIFMPLLCGASMVIAKPEGHRDMRYCAALIHKMRVTAAYFVPAQLPYLVEEIGKGVGHGCHSLRTIAVSGEVLSPLMAQSLLSHLPHIR